MCGALSRAVVITDSVQLCFTVDVVVVAVVFPLLLLFLLLLFFFFVCNLFTGNKDTLLQYF